MRDVGTQSTGQWSVPLSTRKVKSIQQGELGTPCRGDRVWQSSLLQVNPRWLSLWWMGPEGRKRTAADCCPPDGLPLQLTFCPGEMRALTCFSTGFRELS